MPLFRYTPESDPSVTFFWKLPPPAPGAESRPHQHVTPISTIVNTTGESSSSSSTLETLKSKYDTLPTCLKSCLDYCSMVCTMNVDESRGPKLEIVERNRLVRLLVAEGLIEENPVDIMEDIAATIIDQLIGLGFLKPSYLDQEWLRVLQPSGELCLVSGEKQDYDAKSVDSLLRVFIHLDSKSVVNNLPPFLENIPIQSLFIKSRIREHPISEEYLKTVFGLHSLVVLDLDFRCHVACLPDEVGDLVHLRHFRMLVKNDSGSELTELPGSLGNLLKLQTLEIGWFNQPHQLPVEVLNIKTLRHLLVYRTILDRRIRFPRGLGRLVNLQTCWNVYAGGGIADELSSLTQLRCLVITHLSEDHVSDLLEAVMKMKNLVSLTLGSDHVFFGGEWHRILPFLEPFSPPQFLQEIRLVGTLMEMPNWIVSMQNLSNLSLWYSNLSENDVSILQFLPMLKILELWNAYKPKLIGKDFCTVGGFSKLETLIISSVLLVGWIEIVNGAFSSLKILQFFNCKNLKFLPDGLQHISTLEELTLANSNQDLARRLKGEEHYKIKQVSKFLY